MTHSPAFGGIDCGKDTLDLAVYPAGPRLRTGNTPHGHRELIARLGEAGVTTVGLEASGGYERPVRDALRHAGIAVHVLDPVRVRHFAKALGRRAKTDAIDAGVIAAFVAHAGALPGTPVDPEREALADLLRVRRGLTDKRADLQKATARLPEAARRLVTPALEALGRSIAALEEEIRRRIAAHRGLARTVERLRSAPGVGWLSAVSLAVLMPELGRISGAQAAALLGVAPYCHDSGRHRGERHIAGGRAEARQGVYMAVLSAACRQSGGVLAGFYARLIAKGKPPKVALTACMRKLIVRLNAMLAHDQTWSDQPT